MNCNWINIGGNLWECSNCKKQRQWTKEGNPPPRNCSTAPTEGPSFIQMAKNFAVAVKNHVQDGAQKVTQEAFEARLKQCEGSETDGITKCEAYQDGRCKDKNCGCILAFKAQLRSEQCPRQKWDPDPPTA